MAFTRLVGLLALAAAASAAYMDPMVAQAPGVCAKDAEDAALMCGLQRQCEGVELFGDDAEALKGDFPNGFTLCFHYGLFEAAGLDFGAAAVVFLCTVLASCAGCGGGGLYVPALLTVGGFLAEEAAPLAQAAVVGNAVAQTLLNCAWTQNVNYALPMLVMPALLPGYVLGQFVQPVLPASVLTVFAVCVLAVAAWQAWAARSACAAAAADAVDMQSQGMAEMDSMSFEHQASQSLVADSEVGSQEEPEVLRKSRRSSSPTHADVAAAAETAPGPIQDASTRTLALAAGAFWVLSTVCLVGMRMAGLCGGAHAGWAAALMAVAAGFVVVGQRIAPAQARASGAVTAVAFVVGLATGVVGLGAGELAVVLLLNMGLAPEIAAATASFMVAVLGSSGLAMELAHGAGSQFLHPGYLAFFGAAAVLGALAARWLMASRARAVPSVAVMFTVACMVLLGTVYVAEGDKAWWPPQSPCAAGDSDLTIVFSDFHSRERAAERLAGLGLADAGALQDGLSTGQGEGRGTVELARDAKKAAVTPAAFHTEATVAGRKAALDVVQVGTKTHVAAYLAGNRTAGVLARVDGAAQRRHAHELGLNLTNFKLGELLPGLGDEVSDLFSFKDAMCDIVSDPTVRKVTDFLKDPSVSGAIKVIQDKKIQQALDPKISKALSVLADPHIAGALNPTIQGALEVLRNPSLDGALDVLADPNLLGNDTRFVAALDLLKDPSLDGALALLKNPSIRGAMDPRIGKALDFLGSPSLKNALNVLKNPSLEGAIGVLTDPKIIGNLDPKLQGALEALKDPALKKAFAVLKNPSVDGALAVLADVAVAADLDERIVMAIDVVREPTVANALALVTDPSISGALGPQIAGALEMLQDGTVQDMLAVLKEPTIEGALGVLTDDRIMAQLDPRLQEALKRVQDPRFRSALNVLKNPSLSGAVDLLAASGIMDKLDSRIQAALQVVKEPNVKDALALLADANVVGSLDPRVQGALDLLKGDTVTQVLSALKDEGLVDAVYILTDPSITATLDPRVQQAVALLRKPTVKGALEIMRDAGALGALEPKVMEALKVLKGDLVEQALDLLRNAAAAPSRDAQTLAVTPRIQKAVDRLMDPTFLSVLDLLKKPTLAGALDLLTDAKVLEKLDPRIEGALEVLRSPSVDGALAVLRDMDIDVPMNPTIRGALEVLRSPSLGGVLAVLQDSGVTSTADPRIQAALGMMRDPTFLGAMDKRVRGALAALKDPSFDSVLALLDDATLQLPADSDVAAAVAVLRNPTLRSALDVLKNPSVDGALELFADISMQAGLDPRIGQAMEVLRNPSVDGALAVLREMDIDLPLDPRIRGALDVLKNPSLGGVMAVLQDPSVTGTLDPRIQSALQLVTGGSAGAADARVRGALSVLKDPSLRAILDVLNDPAVEVDPRIAAAVDVLREPSLNGVLDLLQSEEVTGALDLLADPRVQAGLTLVRNPTVEQALALLKDPSVVGVLDPRIAQALDLVPVFQQALAGDFSGLLDMAPPQLAPFAEFLQAPEKGLDLGGHIPFPEGSNVDLSKALISKEVLDFELKTVAPARVPLGPGVAVDEAWFRVRAGRNNTAGEWKLDFDVAGTFVIDMDGTELRVPCIVSSPKLGELTLRAEIEATTLTLRGLDIDVRQVQVEGSVAVDSNGVRGALAFRAVTGVGAASFGLAGEVLPTSGDFYLVHTVEDASLGTMLDITAAFVGLDQDKAFSFVGADWRDGLVVRDMAVAIATSDLEGVDPFRTGQPQKLIQGLAYKLTVDVRGFVAQVDGSITRTGLELSGALLEADMDQLGPVADHVEIDALEGALKITWDTPSVNFFVRGEVTLYHVDLDLLVAVSHMEGEGLDLLVYAHAEPEPQVFSLGAVFPVLNGTVASEIGFQSVTFLYSTKHRDLGYPGVPALAGREIEKGFTLQAEVTAFDALETLLKENLPPMLLRAVLPWAGINGREAQELVAGPAIEMTLPDYVSIDLGENCRAKAPVVRFFTEAPLVGVGVTFPLEVGVPGRDVLEFEVGLDLTPVDATAFSTMKGWWHSPFDVAGLKIGPEVHMELSIVYATFAASGLPASLGFRGGLQLGRIAGDLAVRVSQVPTDNVAYGRLYPVDQDTQKPAVGQPIVPADLVDGFGEVCKLDLPSEKVPDFFQVHNMELIIAAGPGQLGSLRYQPGLSFEADVEILGTRVYSNATVNTEMIAFYGSVEPFSIGPVEVKGLTGANLTMAMELSAARQSVEFDGAISLFGVDLGARVMVRGVTDVEFMVLLDFGPIFQFECVGRSIGTDRIEGFALRATMQTDIINWIQERIVAGLTRLQEYVDLAEEKVDAAEKEYRALYDPAYEKLEAARAKVDKLREELKAKVYNATEAMLQRVKEKRLELEATAKEWGDKVRDQKKKVDELHGAFEAGLKKAEEQVERARRAYNRKRAELNEKFEAAKRSLATTMSAARSKVAGAKRAADEAGRQHNIHKQQLDGCRWYQVGCKVSNGAKVAFYWAKQGVLNAAHKAAMAALNVAENIGKQVLNTAQQALMKIGDTVEKIAFDTAMKVLNEAVRGTAKKLADAAKRGLDQLGRVVEEYGPHGVAAKALEFAEVEGREAVRIAVEAVDGIAKTTTHAAFDSARGALEAVEEGTVAVSFKTAKLALSATSDLIDRVKELGMDVFRLDKLELAATIVPGQSVYAFDATLEMTILGEPMKASLSFEPGHLDANQDFTTKLLGIAQEEGQRVVDQVAHG